MTPLKLASLAAAIAFVAGPALAQSQVQDPKQQEVFRRIFPDGSVPVDIRSRLASEARSALKKSAAKSSKASRAAAETL